MKILYDHTVNPPTAHYPKPGKSCIFVKDTSIPSTCTDLPAGLYWDGGNDPIPEGHKATSWTRVIRDGLSVNVPTTEPSDPEAELQASYAARASTILQDQDAVAAVQDVLVCVQTLAGLGVDITEWTFQAIAAAAKNKAKTITEIATKFAILQAAFELRVAWDRIIYHCGDTKSADDLWNSMISQVAP